MFYLHVGDLGKDFEHCLELQKKLDDVDGDMRVDESRISEVGTIIIITVIILTIFEGCFIILLHLV